MCGIIGIFRRQGIRQGDEQALDCGMEQMARRGPDGEGRHRTPQVLLGHRRLAILDVSQGRQPWVDDASGVVLCYNGELYNFRELREELKSEGHVFRTDCDTEVLLAAYLQWGAECLHRLEGIFAFALLDPRRERLWLVRDRFGIKPLYYAKIADGLVFASSVAALLAFPEVGRRWDPAALVHYFLTIRTTLGEQTLLRQVCSLEPGRELRIGLGDGRWERRIYWSLPRLAASQKEQVSDLQQCARTVRERLDATVGRQLISDVPVGGFLSGGIDSSILMAAVLRHRTEGFGACSVGYPRSQYNEWNHVRRASDFHGVDCRELALREEDFRTDWEELIRFKGLPLSTPNEVPIRKLAESFGEQYTVALTGEGADEIFGGYAGPTFCAYDYERSLGREGGIAEPALQRAYGTSRFSGRQDHFFRVNSWIDLERQKRELPGLHAADAERTVLDWYAERFEETAACSTFDAYLHLHVRVNLEGLLNRLDSSTMYASVEGRVPFTDTETAAWVFSLPDEVKMALCDDIPAHERHWRTSFDLIGRDAVETKRLLRMAYADRVDRRILERRKVSFPVPFQEWMEGPLLEPSRSLLRESAVVSHLRGPGKGLERIDGMMGWPMLNLALMEKIWKVTI